MVHLVQPLGTHVAQRTQLPERICLGLSDQGLSVPLLLDNPVLV